MSYSFLGKKIIGTYETNYNIDEDAFYKYKSEKWKLHDILNSNIKKIIEEKSHEIYKISLDILFDYSTHLIREGLYSEAFKEYFNLYYKLKDAWYYSKEFIENLDKTEMFYNMGYLKYSNGEFDDAIFFLAEADKEYSQFYNVSEGSFLISLLESEEPVCFWNFITNIYVNCINYDSFAYAFKYFSFFGEESCSKDRINELLKDFDLILLLQFIITVDRYFKWLPMNHNLIKGIRVSRTFGELAWLFECYLKNITSEPDKTLSKLIDKIIPYDKEIEKEYKKLNNMGGTSNNDKFNSIIKLIEIQEKETNFSTKQALGLKTVYFLRNYSAHSLDKNFMVFKDDAFTKKIFLSALMSFFTVYNIKSKYIKV